MDNPYHRYHMNIMDRTRKINSFTTNKDIQIRRKIHGFLSNNDMDKEYEELMNQKKLKTKSGVINLTSETLKKEYSNMFNYFKSGIQFMLLISFMLFTNTFFEFKYFKASELSVSILISSFISAGFCIILLISINQKVLLDIVGYSTFYLSAMIETALFFFLLLIKIYDFFFVINELIKTYKYKNKENEENFLSYKTFVFLILFNIVNILGILFCSKFILDLFLEGYNILIMKKKTIIHKQLEIYSNEKNRKIEFVDDDSYDINEANSKDVIKIE